MQFSFAVARQNVAGAIRVPELVESWITEGREVAEELDVFVLSGFEDLTHGVPGIQDHSAESSRPRELTMTISRPTLCRGGLASLNLNREIRRTE